MTQNKSSKSLTSDPYELGPRQLVLEKVSTLPIEAIEGIQVEEVNNEEVKVFESYRVRSEGRTNTDE